MDAAKLLFLLVESSPFAVLLVLVVWLVTLPPDSMGRTEGQSVSKIVIIGIERSVDLMLLRLLEKGGYPDTAIVLSQKALAEELAGGNVALVILDPTELLGMRVLSLLQGSDVPILAIPPVKLHVEGAVAVVVRPFDIEEFLAVVRKALGE